MDIPTITGLLNAIQSFITILAIVVGGIWSYLTFVRKRQKYPCAKIEHKIECRPLPNNKYLLSVDIFITNTGEVLLSLVSWEINIQQVLPPQAELKRFLTHKTEEPAITTAKQIIEWKLLASRKDRWEKGEFEVEPGEMHQIHSDFLIDAKVETILVESFFQNIAKNKKQTEWNRSTLHDLQPREKKDGHLQ